jgi:hypothetical protein
MDVPESLKPMSPYLQKSKELQKAEPVVAHFCKVYAIEVGCKVSIQFALGLNLATNRFFIDTSGLLCSLRLGYCENSVN